MIGVVVMQVAVELLSISSDGVEMEGQAGLPRIVQAGAGLRPSFFNLTHFSHAQMSWRRSQCFVTVRECNDST